MNINILLISVIIILAVGGFWGWKRGLLESIIRIVSCVLGILVLVILAKGIGSFMQGRYMNVFMAVILLLAIRIIHKIVQFLIDTFKLVRALPIGKLADKLAGMVLGFVEAVFCVWLLFLVVGSFDLLGLNAWLMGQVEQSRLLSTLYYSNYLVELLRRVL